MRETQEQIKRLKEIKEIGGKSGGAKTSGIGHLSREFGRISSTRMLSIECPFRVI
jgi:hypothetical protein